MPLSKHHNQHSNTGSTNDVSLGWNYLFCGPIPDSGSVRQTFLKTVFIFATEITHFSLNMFTLTVWCLQSAETDREDRIWQQRRNARDPLKTIRHKLTFIIRFGQPRLQSQGILFSYTYHGFVSWFLLKDLANSERENKNSSIKQVTLISKCRSFSTVSPTAGAITSYIFCKMVSALIFYSHRSTKRVDKCHLWRTALQ